MNYMNSILETIGFTPLVRLNKIEKKYNLSYRLFAKIEKFNPGGSIKDRASFYMIKGALENGLINKDTLIIEPTSGNTGVSLAMICAYYNLKLHIYMPSSCSKERIDLIKAYGGKVILTDSSLGMKGAKEKALKEFDAISNSYMPSQFENRNNELSHYETTSKELILSLDADIDAFICGIGTGGTIMGISKSFKDKNLKTKIIGVEPFSSPLISQNIYSSHKIQGIGANFLPDLIDKEYIDEFILVKVEDAYEMTNILAKEEGILVGLSSGASLKAGISLDKNKYKDKNVVILLPDTGERYLSVDGLFE